MINKKSEIGINTIFYIFMISLFVGALIFGVSKIFLIKEVIDDDELIKVKNTIKQKFKICENPLNKETIQNINVKKSIANGYCILNSENIKIFTIENDNLIIKNNVSFLKTLNQIKVSGKNVILLKLKLNNENEIIENKIIATSKIISNQNSYCFFDFSNSKTSELKLIC